MTSKKKIRFAFKQVAEIAESARCESLHHKATQFHTEGDMCPAEYDLYAKVEELRNYLKKQGVL